jgi:response regulator NasT
MPSDVVWTTVVPLSTRGARAMPEHDLSAKNSGSLPQPRSPVLIVETDRGVAARLNHHLSELLCDAIWTPEPDEALQQIEALPAVECVVVNLRLRTANGDPIVRRLQEGHGCAVVPYENDSDHSPETAVAAAACGILLWPPAADRLQACLAYASSHHKRMSDQAAEIETLRRRLEDRRIIERAKWLLVEQFEITEPAAMRWLQKQSRSSRRAMRETAQSVLDLAESPVPPEAKARLHDAPRHADLAIDPRRR